MTRRPVHFLSVRLPRVEWEHVKAAAKRDGVTTANYVRGCINSAWVEEGDDGPLLTAYHAGRPKGAAR